MSFSGEELSRMPEQRIHIDQLRVGIFIRLEINWTHHPFLFRSFKIKSEDQIDALKELGLRSVVFVPEKSDCMPGPLSAVSEETLEAASSQTGQDTARQASDALWEQKRTRVEFQRKHRRAIAACQEKFEQTMQRVNRVITNLGTASAEVLEEAESIMREIASALVSDKDNAVHLVNTKAGAQDFFNHALNTSVLGMIVAREYGFREGALQKLGLGLLFHDIGKFRIPKSILLKQASMTRAEIESLQLHPVYGEEMLSAAKGFPSESLDVVRHHHERIDGSGYPDKLSGNQVSMGARVASLVNTYDNHCNKHDPKNSLTPAQTVSFMFTRQRSLFDPQLLTTFIRCMGIHPPGSVVLLTDESIGMVISVNSRNSLRPQVLVYDPETPRKEAPIIDLEAMPELNILKSLRPGDLPPEVFDYLSPRTRVAYFIEQGAMKIKP